MTVSIRRPEAVVVFAHPPASDAKSAPASAIAFRIVQRPALTELSGPAA